MLADYSPLFRLNVAERLELVGALWDSIAIEPAKLPISDWQREELGRRDAEFQKNPEIALSWEDAKRQIRGEPDA